MNIYARIMIAKKGVQFRFESWIDFKDFLSSWFKYCITSTWIVEIQAFSKKEEKP